MSARNPPARAARPSACASPSGRAPAALEVGPRPGPPPPAPTQVPRGARPARVPPAGGGAQGVPELHSGAEVGSPGAGLGGKQERARDALGAAQSGGDRERNPRHCGERVRGGGGGREKPESPSRGIPGTWDLRLPSALPPTSSPPCRERPGKGRGHRESSRDQPGPPPPLRSAPLLPTWSQTEVSGLGAEPPTVPEGRRRPAVARASPRCWRRRSPQRSPPSCVRPSGSARASAWLRAQRRVGRAGGRWGPWRGLRAGGRAACGPESRGGGGGGGAESPSPSRRGGRVRGYILGAGPAPRGSWNCAAGLLVMFSHYSQP